MSRNWEKLSEQGSIVENGNEEDRYVINLKGKENDLSSLVFELWLMIQRDEGFQE